MDPEDFEYEEGTWLVREERRGDGAWPYWHVFGRLYDVDDGSRHYRLSWQHPLTGEYREEVVPSSDALADFQRVPEEAVLEAGEELQFDDPG